MGFFTACSIQLNLKTHIGSESTPVLNLKYSVLFHYCCNSETAIKVPVEIKAVSIEVHPTPNKLQ